MHFTRDVQEWTRTECREGRYRRGQLRYLPIVAYLAACDEEVVALSFAQIEAMSSTPPNDGAYVDAHFWTSPQFDYVQRWQALGWRARLDKGTRRVSFTHDYEEEVSQ